MRTLLAASLIPLVVFAAGCGGSSSSGNTNTNSPSGEASKPAAQVLTDAARAATAATSLHLSGQVNAGGQQIGIDLSIENGKGATGSITLKGATVEMTVIGTKAYIKAGADFFNNYLGTSSSAALISLLANKWITFPTTTSQFAGFTSFTNADALFAKLKHSAGKVTSNGATTFKGQSVVAINGGPSNGVLYVANTGTPYPVALVKSGGSSSGEIDFSGWNASVALTAPSGALDFSSIAHG